LGGVGVVWEWKGRGKRGEGEEEEMTRSVSRDDARSARVCAKSEEGSAAAGCDRGAVLALVFNFNFF
jgi:hypothetical protein